MAVEAPARDELFEGLVERFGELVGDGYAPQFDGYEVAERFIGRGSEPRVVILSDNDDARRFRGLVEDFVGAHGSFEGDELAVRNAVSSTAAGYVQPLLDRMGWTPDIAA